VANVFGKVLNGLASLELVPQWIVFWVDQKILGISLTRQIPCPFSIDHEEDVPDGRILWQNNGKSFQILWRIVLL
jgi:hypothetical protein